MRIDSVYKMSTNILHHLFFISTLFIQYIDGEVRISVSVPVTPVDEGAILSIHCQIWELSSEYHVIISTEKLTLTMSETILSGIPDRYFLVVRQFQDGSSVYFLSVTDVTKADMGVYTCKVVDSSGETFRNLGSESVNVDVASFPTVTDPVCEPLGKITIYEGSKIKLNCSSEKTIPSVDMSWSQSASAQDSLNVVTSEDNGRLYGVHLLQVSRKHHESIFVCKITSKAFPTRTQTCHVGPIHVIKRPRDTTLPPSVDQSDILYGISHEQPVSGDGGVQMIPDSELCNEVCATEDSYTFYWMIATIVTCILAVVFLLVAIVMFIRYWNIPTYAQPKYVIPQKPSEEIYVDLEGRPRSKNSVYMTLEKIKCPTDHRMLHSGGEMLN